MGQLGLGLEEGGADGGGVNEKQLSVLLEMGFSAPHATVTPRTCSMRTQHASVSMRMSAIGLGGALGGHARHGPSEGRGT